MLQSPTPGNENQRIIQSKMTVPVKIECQINQFVSWNKITRISDVSAFGAKFDLPHPVKRGRLVHLTLPLPRQLRNYDFVEPQYSVWGLVRHCIPFHKSPVAPETYSVGTAFIGKHPPKSYADNPSMLYDAVQLDGENFWQVTEANPFPDETNLPKEYRRHSRYQLPINVMLELLDNRRQVQSGEFAVTENVSLGGASVFTTLNAEIGSFVNFVSDQYNVSIVAVVRGKRAGLDGFPRLHLEFIDRYFPLEGIEDIS